jgi:predicted permease
LIRKAGTFIRRFRKPSGAGRATSDFTTGLETHEAMHPEAGASFDSRKARRRSLIRPDDQEQTPQACRDQSMHALFEGLLQDARYALRQLPRSPGFCATVVLTLALGIGANLAIFQLLHAVVFAHLPIDHPEEIHSLHCVPSPFDGEWFNSYAAYQRLRQATIHAVPVFARSGIGTGVLMQSDGGAGRNEFQMVSDNFFPVLGLRPAAGRFFQPGDDGRLQNEWPVVLRYGFFRQRFAGDRSIIGQRATLNGIPIVIIGVAPEGFNGVVQGVAPDIWLPLAAQSTGRFGTWFDSLGPGNGVNLDKPWANQPTVFWLWTLTRTKNALQPALTDAWTAAFAPDLALIAAAAKDPQRIAQVASAHVTLVSAANGEGTFGQVYSMPLTVLMAMAAVVLLVGCLNLANLQMARLLQREREIAIRIALGASRLRVLRQVAMETVILAALGGGLAILTSRLGAPLLLHWASPRGESIPLDLHMGSFAALLGATLLLAAFFAFGLLPAWQITRRSFSRATKSRVGNVAGQSRAGRRASNLLLAGQVSLSLLLLSAAALFAQTLRNIGGIDAGVDRAHVLSVHLDMRSTGFAEHKGDLSAFYGVLLNRLKALPEVRDASVEMCEIPHCGWNTAVHVFGNTALVEGQLHGEENHVGVGYFQTLGIPLIAGRVFSSQDQPGSTHVAILSRSYERKLFGDASSIGRWIGYNAAPLDHQFQIVGVVADARVDGLRADAPPVVYLPLEQNPQPVQTIDVRARGSLQTLPIEIRELLHTVEPALPVTEIVPLDVEFHDGLSREELLARLTGLFGALSLALAALGFYGMLSFRVARRTTEIGIRMAMGSTRTQVVMLFLRQTLAILVVGILPGAALSLGLRISARRLLYGTGTMEVSALAISVAILAFVGILATLIPARRAASIDPVDALRAE